ncbi:MAG TPA: hypothetical protein VF898_12140, partial [Chloroflexota bacterium]
EWQSIPIVVLTAKDIGPDERRRLNGRVEKVIQKGALTIDDLLSQMRQLVASHIAAGQED